MKSIQAKLTVVILVIFLVALGTLGGLNYWKARQLVYDNVRDSVVKVVAGASAEVGLWLDARKAEMAAIATMPVVAQGNPEAMTPLFVAFNKANPIYETVFFADASGTYRTYEGKTGSIAQRPYFQKGMRGEASISDPVKSGATGNTVVVIAVPVKAEGRIIGIIFGAITVDDLSRRVLAVKMGQTGYAFVLQSDGLAIFHPSKEQAMKTNPVKDEKIPPGLREVSQRMVKGESGFSSYEWQGVEKAVGFTPVSGVAWSLAVSVPLEEITGAVSALTVISLVTIAVVLIIAGIFIAWYARRIARPIMALEAAADRIAGGDVSRDELAIDSDDEIGRLGKSFDQMAGNLRGLIRKILGATEQVASSSQQLTATSQQAAQAASDIASAITAVASGAEEQQAAAGKTTAIVEQMSSTIQQVAANAQQVADQSAQAADKAKNGDQSVTQAVGQMDRIETTVNTSAEVVAKLGERSKEIGLIVDTIAGIAGQTNLLALNAAIEAARAGEQGRGFAVVAEEVRKLAEQSQEAAGKIADLIGEIRGDTDRAVAAMDEGTREVKAGTEIVKNAGATFREIASLVAEVSGQIKDISAAISQMATGSREIVAAVKTIDELGKLSAGKTQSVSAAAQQQLAAMEEIASSSQELAQLAQELQTAAGQFRL